MGIESTPKRKIERRDAEAQSFHFRKPMATALSSVISTRLIKC